MRRSLFRCGLLVAMLGPGCGSQPTDAVPVVDTDPPAPVVAADPVAVADPVAEPLPEPQLPALGPQQYEWHGRWNGERFWARLGPHDPAFGGRVLKLVYTQPAPEAVDGTLLAPHPWLLLGEDLAISAWLERSRLSRAEYRSDTEPPGYGVSQETERRVGDDVFADERRVRIPGPRGWDRRLAPLLLAAVWRSDSRGEVAVYDLMAADPAPAILRWEGPRIEMGGRSWRAEPDAAGRLHRLQDPAGGLVLEVSEHLPPLEAEAALERERSFLEDLGGG